VAEELLSERHGKVYNKVVEHAKSTRSLVLRYCPLERASLHSCGYADASFASKYDNSSQLCFRALLCDGADRCHVLTYASKKARRVVKSIMAGEVYAFADVFDAAYILKHDFERLYDQPLPLVC